MDCSGLVWLAAALEGVLFPRDAKDQCAWLRESARGGLPGPGEKISLRLGDLVFFGPSGGKADHVGIGSGGGRFIHASRRVRYSSLIPGRDDFEPVLRSRVLWVTAIR
jgi:cell wall-associated NlpC family hydrolase